MEWTEIWVLVETLEQVAVLVSPDLKASQVKEYFYWTVFKCLLISIYFFFKK